MFTIGEKIVYPMYGAGTVEEIEEKKVDGHIEQYYVITIPHGSLKIRLSSQKAEGMGLRKVANGDIVLEQIRQAASKPIVAADNWNIRYKENLQKIRTGQIIEVAEVVRNLLVREASRTLSGAEKKMLNNARQILLSEIVESQGIKKEAAEDLLMESLLNVVAK